MKQPDSENLLNVVHKLGLDNRLKRFGHLSSGVKAWPVGGHKARSRACVGLEA